MAPGWAAPGFDPLGMLGELVGQARFVAIGEVAGALHGWPILLGRRVLEIVPAESAMGRVEDVARRLGAEAGGGAAGGVTALGAAVGRAAARDARSGRDAWVSRSRA